MDQSIIVDAEKMLGNVDEAQQLLKRADFLQKDSSKPSIAFVGRAGAGKTTLINTMLGKTIREPQMIPDETQKPLRISFRRVAKNESLECVEIVSAIWEEKVDFIYEIDLNQREDVEKMQPLLDKIDYYFYVVNATAPLSKLDDEIITLLPKGGVTIVVSHIASLINRRNGGSTVESLREYIADYCKSHEMPEPLFPELEAPENQDGEALGKHIRYCLPDDDVLCALRTARANGMVLRAADEVRQKIFTAIYQNENDREQARDLYTQDYMSVERKKAIWGAVRANMIERGVELSKQVNDELLAQTENLTQYLMEDGRKHKFSEQWCKDILPKITEQFEAEFLNEYRKEINNRVNQDVKNFLKDAIDLQIVPASFILDDGVVENSSIAGSINKNQGSNNLHAKIATIAGGAVTAAFTGGFALFNLSVPVAVLVTTAVAGVTAYKFVHINSENERGWMNQLKEYARLNLHKLASSVREEIFRFYESIGDQVQQKSVQNDTVFDGTPYDQRRQMLEELLEKLN